MKWIKSFLFYWFILFLSDTTLDDASYKKLQKQMIRYICWLLNKVDLEVF